MSAPTAAEIEGVLSEIVERAGGRPAGKFGVFLHGSRQFGAPRPDSDIDVIVLSDPSAPDEAAALREEFGSLAGPGGVLLDLKVVPADVFGADPWVPLGRARLLGGHDWRTELGEPGFDAVARESINVFAAIVGFGDFDQADPSRVVKPLQRLCSVLVIVGRHSAPASGREAVEALADVNRLAEPVRLLASTALSVLAQTENATAPMPVALTEAITNLIGAVIGIVATNSPRVALGRGARRRGCAFWPLVTVSGHPKADLILSHRRWR